MLYEANFVCTDFLFFYSVYFYGVAFVPFVLSLCAEADGRGGGKGPCPLQTIDKKIKTQLPH